MWRQLYRMERKLDLIILAEGIDMADEAALDEAIAQLSTNVDELQAATQSIVDKVSNLPDAPDLSDELETINSLSQRVTDTKASIDEAVAAGEPTTTEENPPAEPVS